MRLFLVWDSDSISEQTDTVVEDLFEAVEADSSSEESGGKRKRKGEGPKPKRKLAASPAQSLVLSLMRRPEHKFDRR